MIAFCLSLLVKQMPLWLGQRLNKDYLPSAENMHPTKRGRCSRPGWLAVPAPPSAQWGQPIKGVMSQRVKPHLCWWWGLSLDSRVPAASFRGCMEPCSQESLLAIVPDETGQKMVLWGRSQATLASHLASVWWQTCVIFAYHRVMVWLT